MKLPERPPNWREIFQWNLFLEKRDGIQPLMRIVEDHYFYWDEFKYKTLPPGVSPELGWSFVKFSRMQDAKGISLKSKEGGSFFHCSTSKILQSLHRIDRDVPKQIIADRELGIGDRYIISSLMEEAIASSQIEGAATTRIVAKEMLRTGRKPKDNSEQMVLNNYRAIQAIRNLKSEQLSIDMLHRLHRILTENTTVKSSDVGRFRTSADPVQVYDDRDGTLLFDPPPAEQLKERLEKLIAFANQDDDSKEFIHPVIKAIILHFWLAYEHPYVDGNGRTARALFYWYMLKRGYWLFEFISISRVLLKAPAQYARSFLYTEYDENDLTYFIHYNIRAINMALKELELYLVRKQTDYLTTRELLKNFPDINQRQYFLLADAIKKSTVEYTIKGYQTESKITYQTARTDLLSLVEKGLLQMVKRGKKFVFIPAENLHEKLEALTPTKAKKGGLL